MGKKTGFKQCSQLKDLHGRADSLFIHYQPVISIILAEIFPFLKLIHDLSCRIVRTTKIYQHEKSRSGESNFRKDRNSQG